MLIKHCMQPFPANKLIKAGYLHRAKMQSQSKHDDKKSFISQAKGSNHRKSENISNGMLVLLPLCYVWAGNCLLS